MNTTKRTTYTADDLVRGVLLRLKESELGLFINDDEFHLTFNEILPEETRKQIFGHLTHNRFQKLTNLITNYTGSRILLKGKRNMYGILDPKKSGLGQISNSLDKNQELEHTVRDISFQYSCKIIPRL